MIATISRTHASLRTWDAAIVGAGPAGGMMALLLARRGWRILLLERSTFPRTKACGYCLNQAGADVLRRAGIDSILDSAPRLDSLLLRRGGHEIRLDVPASFCTPRDVLDQRLVEHAIAAGAHFIPECSARLETAGAKCSRTLRLAHANTHSLVSASLVLACDGLGGTLLDQHRQCRWSVARNAWIGASLTLDEPRAWAPAGVIAMHVAPHGYVGAIRLADGRTHLAAALDPAECRRSGGAAQFIQRILPESVAVSARLHGTPLLTRRRLCLVAHRILAVGDACGYVEPFTGEGMTWALRAAESLADLLGDAPGAWNPRLPALWTLRHRMLLGWHQALCHGVRQVLHCEPASAAAFAAAGRLPFVGRALARVIGQGESRSGGAS